jgi:hypothetical protein
MSTCPLRPNVLINSPFFALDLADAAVGRQDYPPVRAIPALPVGDTTLGCLLGRRPELPASRRVKRHHRVLRSGHIHHLVDDERIERQAHGVAWHRIKPRGLELLDVAAVDLGEG